MKSSPISELQRHYAALAQDARESKEPIYLTRHGRADLVLVDAEEYAKRDQVYERQRAVFQHEMKIKAELDKAHEEFLAGKGIPLEQVVAELEMKWGPLDLSQEGMQEEDSAEGDDNAIAL